MARRGRNEINVELFPFLSILASVIGVLALAIAGSVVGQMDTETVRDIERAKEYERIQEDLTEREEKVKKLRKLIAKAEKAEKLENKVESSRQEASDLEKKKEKIQDRKKRLKKKNKEITKTIEELKRQIARLKDNLESTRKKAESLEKKLSEMNEPPDPADIVVQPGGSGEVDAELLSRALFGECRENAIVLYEDLSGEKTERFPRNGIRKNLEFIEKLDEMAVKEQWLVLLVRPDGARTARRVERLANRRGAYNGKLPVPGEGRLDLTQFRKLLETSA